VIRLPAIISFLLRPPILRHSTIHVTAVLFALPYESTHGTATRPQTYSVTLLLHISQVRDSSISLQTGDPDWLSWLSSAPPRTMYLISGHECFLPRSFLFIIHWSSWHRTV